MIFITMPAARQYTEQITLHENGTIHYYTLYIYTIPKRYLIIITWLHDSL